jgi:NAD(P)-dependent dehydrogenase (short-subunit alcohol dehydrogenase family)
MLDDRIVLITGASRGIGASAVNRSQVPAAAQQARA